VPRDLQERPVLREKSVPRVLKEKSVLRVLREPPVLKETLV
jgi:hypothetical protein